MAHFEISQGATDEWYTPEYVFDALGAVFDVDVAGPANTALYWVPALRKITPANADENWRGFVWLNPPFGGRNGIVPWLNRFFTHGNGVCLTPDRTSAPWWQAAAKRADGVLFVSPKIRFIGKGGKLGAAPSTGTTLMASGIDGLAALFRAQSTGLGVMFTRS